MRQKAGTWNTHVLDVCLSGIYPSAPPHDYLLRDLLGANRPRKRRLDMSGEGYPAVSEVETNSDERRLLVLSPAQASPFGKACFGIRSSTYPVCRNYSCGAVRHVLPFLLTARLPSSHCI